MGGEDVESYRILLVGWVKQNDVFSTIGWNSAKQLVHQVAVRIEQGDTSTLLYILANQIEQQRGLARAGGPDHVHVAHPLFGAKAYGHGPAGMEVESEQES